MFFTFWAGQAAIRRAEIEARKKKQLRVLATLGAQAQEGCQEAFQAWRASHTASREQVEATKKKRERVFAALGKEAGTACSLAMLAWREHVSKCREGSVRERLRELEQQVRSDE